VDVSAKVFEGVGEWDVEFVVVTEDEVLGRFFISIRRHATSRDEEGFSFRISLVGAIGVEVVRSKPAVSELSTLSTPPQLNIRSLLIVYHTCIDFVSKMTVQYTDPFRPAWQTPWLRMMLQWKGSIFQFLWIEFTVAVSVYALVLTIWYLALRVVQDGDLPPEKEAVFEAFGFVNCRFQAAISLMLGFYTSTIYNRWWKVRDVEGVVVIGRVNDLAVQIAALVQDAPMGDSPAADESTPRNVSEDLLPATNENMNNDVHKSIGSLSGNTLSMGKFHTRTRTMKVCEKS
jgi:hypothetical protein